MAWQVKCCDGIAKIAQIGATFLFPVELSTMAHAAVVLG